MKILNISCMASSGEGYRKTRNEFYEKDHATRSMVQDSLSDATIIEKRGSTGVATIRTTTGKREANLHCNALKTDLWAESISLWESASKESHKSNSDSDVPKGCQFSPDGTCLLTARANKLELYNTPFEKEEDDSESGNSRSGGGWEPALTCNSGESVRSYTWYPHMKSSDPASCCFLGVSRGSPVHLYDAYDGSIRASYRPYNALDEMESPTTLCFAENGQKLVTGGLRSDRILHVFDVNRPGREHAPPLLKLGKTRRSKDGQKGLVSAMAYSERKGVIAVGTYSPGSIYLYDLRTYARSAVAEIVMSSSASTSSGGAVCVAGHGKKGKKNKRKRFVSSDDDAPAGETAAKDGTGVDNPSPPQPSMNFSAAKLQWYQSRTRGGVTQVEFEDEDENGAGGHYLFSTSRRSNAILQWDLRKLSSSNFCPGIANFETSNDSNQRIEFRIKGDQLWTGGIDGCVRVYSHRKQTGIESPLLAKIAGFRDCVNGISLHPDADLNPDKLFAADSNSNDDKDGDGVGCTSNSGFDDKPAKSLLAVAVGRRQFPSENDWEEDNPHASLTNRTKRFVGSTQMYSLGRL